MCSMIRWNYPTILYFRREGPTLYEPGAALALLQHNELPSRRRVARGRCFPSVHSAREYYGNHYTIVHEQTAWGERGHFLSA